MYREHLIWLKQWAERKKHKPLVIRGARQVGKSTLVNLFAEQQRLDLIELNLERNPEYTDVFSQSNPAHIVNTLSLLLSRSTEAGKSVLFLDEVQVKPEIRGILRYFYEKLPDLHVIAAGSLLDFEMVAPTFSVPVGRISYLHMGPMNFAEFLRVLEDFPVFQGIETIASSGQSYFGMSENFPVIQGIEITRMVETLVDHVLRQKPVRQCVGQDNCRRTPYQNAFLQCCFKKYSRTDRLAYVNTRVYPGAFQHTNKIFGWGVAGGRQC